MRWLGSCLLISLCLHSILHCGAISSPSPPPLELTTLLSAISATLTSADITHFLHPGTGLSLQQPFLPVYILPAFTPGAALAVPDPHTPSLLLAIAALQDSGVNGHAILAVETFSGLRLFAEPPPADPSLPADDLTLRDYTEPYVDILLYKCVDDSLICGCCSCRPVGTVLGACAKKTCGCEACTFEVASVLPAVRIALQDVGEIYAPNDIALVVLGSKVSGLHPLFALSPQRLSGQK
jgi:hypothetical protein